MLREPGIVEVKMLEILDMCLATVSPLNLVDFSEIMLLYIS